MNKQIVIGGGGGKGCDIASIVKTIKMFQYSKLSRGVEWIVEINRALRYLFSGYLRFTNVLCNYFCKTAPDPVNRFLGFKVEISSKFRFWPTI